MHENKKIEIVDIDLGINVAEEIKRKVDLLDSNITLYTEDLIERSTQKQQKVSKKAKTNKERNDRLVLAIQFLEKQFELDDVWTTGLEIIKHTELEPTTQNINKLSMQLKKYLKSEDKWTLLKTRKKSRTVYRLARFS